MTCLDMLVVEEEDASASSSRRAEFLVPIHLFPGTFLASLIAFQTCTWHLLEVPGSSIKILDVTWLSQEVNNKVFEGTLEQIEVPGELSNDDDYYSYDCDLCSGGMLNLAHKQSVLNMRPVEVSAVETLVPLQSRTNGLSQSLRGPIKFQGRLRQFSALRPRSRKALNSSTAPWRKSMKIRES